MERRPARQKGLVSCRSATSTRRRAGHVHHYLRRYLILAKHSFRRSSSVRICVSMASCSATEPLLDSSAEALLSRFCLQSRIACLVAIWACDVVLTYVLMQASVIEQVWHS